MAKTRRVALMLELESAYWRHISIFAGAQEYAEAHGWETIIDEFADDTLPARKSKRLPYDGVIARATKKLAERSKRAGVPVVNVWLNSPARQSLPGVFFDHVAMGKMRAEHLLSRGLSRFGAVVAHTVGQVREANAFRQTLADAGYKCSVTKVPLSPSKSLAHWRKTESIIGEWVKECQPPIGVYVSGQDDARIMAQMCRSRGLRIPEDVAIITGYNEPALCEQPRPSLTSIELGGERLGYEAARLLDRLMKGKKPPAEPILIPPKCLVLRESTDFYAVDDEIVAAALEFIACNSHRPIGAEDVSRAVNIETRSLQRRFRKVLDRPVATEIRRVRIERAKRELAQSKRSMAEIAHDVGFGPSMRMYEVFRRELGITPTEYRRQRELDTSG